VHLEISKASPLRQKLLSSYDINPHAISVTN